MKKEFETADVANSIKAIIEKQGLKQKAVAQKAGLKEKTFSNMLTGRKNIDAKDVYYISVALNVKPNDLFGFDSSKS